MYIFISYLSYLLNVIVIRNPNNPNDVHGRYKPLILRMVSISRYTSYIHSNGRAA